MTSDLTALLECLEFGVFMQIDVSFSTFKALTALRDNENGSFNDVISRLLAGPGELKPRVNVLQTLADGLFIGGVLFPDRTRLRARYKDDSLLRR